MERPTPGLVLVTMGNRNVVLVGTELLRSVALDVLCLMVSDIRPVVRIWFEVVGTSGLRGEQRSVYFLRCETERWWFVSGVSAREDEVVSWNCRQLLRFLLGYYGALLQLDAVDAVFAALSPDVLLWALSRPGRWTYPEMQLWLQSVPVVSLREGSWSVNPLVAESAALRIKEICFGVPLLDR